MKNSTELFNTPSNEITSVDRNQGFYDIFLTLVFLMIVVLISWQLSFVGFFLGKFIWLTLIILAFAIFRLTKFVIADGIFQWFRDLFLVVKTERAEQGFIIHRGLPAKGLGREIALLLDCPWCVSVWVSLISIYVWFVCPISRLFFVIMALSGIATLVYIWVKSLQFALESQHLPKE